MKKHFILTSLILILSFILFYITIFSLDPLGEQKNIAFFTFFSSLFLGLSSLFTLTFFFAAETILKTKLGHKAFMISLRRGILTGIFGISFFILQFLRIFDTFEIILIGAFLILIEVIIMSAHAKPPTIN